MTNSWKHATVVTSVALVFISFFAQQLGAHEKGVLRLATRRPAPGDSVATTGEHFSRRATLKIELVGVAGRTRLADVRTDSLGAFRGALVVPANVSAGSYRVVAVAADGDEVASVDVSVVVRAATPISRETPEEPTPSARPLMLTRARSALVTSGVLAVIAVALTGGVLLLRQSGAGARS